MDWIAMFGPIINGLLAKLFSKCSEAKKKETPQEFVARTYDRVAETWPNYVLRPVMNAIVKADKAARNTLSRAEKKQLQPTPRGEQLRQMAIAKLHEVRDATPQQVRVAMALGATMADEVGA